MRLIELSPWTSSITGQLYSNIGWISICPVNVGGITYPFTNFNRAALLLPAVNPSSQISNSIVTGGTIAGYIDKLLCHQWRQSWHPDENVSNVDREELTIIKIMHTIKSRCVEYRCGDNNLLPVTSQTRGFTIETGINRAHAKYKPILQPSKSCQTSVMPLFNTYRLYVYSSFRQTNDYDKNPGLSALAPDQCNDRRSRLVTLPRIHSHTLTTTNWVNQIMKINSTDSPSKFSLGCILLTWYTRDKGVEKQRTNILHLSLEVTWGRPRLVKRTVTYVTCFLIDWGCSYMTQTIDRNGPRVVSPYRRQVII